MLELRLRVERVADADVPRPLGDRSTIRSVCGRSTRSPDPTVQRRPFIVKICARAAVDRELGIGVGVGIGVV